MITSYNFIHFIIQKSRYHRAQTLGYKNGYALPNRPTVGIGGVPIHVNQLSEQELDELANYNPTLTYGQAKQAPPEDYVPAHVAWDKKVNTPLVLIAIIKIRLFHRVTQGQNKHPIHL